MKLSSNVVFIRFDHHLIIRIAVIALSLVFAFLVFRPVRITVNENYVKITGLYGVEVRVEDIYELKLAEELPQIVSRLNGIDMFGLSRRGIYQLQDLGRTRMISFSTGGPFILMNTGNEWIVINFKSPEDTENLYNKLNDVVKR